MAGPNRDHAKAVFAEWLERTGDYRAAAERAGVSARTGRRWRQQQVNDSPPGVRAAAHGLPTYRTRFVGRAAELATLARCFETSRLTTILGYGGIGKTRLAVHFAQVRLCEPDCTGVYYCDLTTARTAEDSCRIAAARAAVELGASHLDQAMDRIGAAIAATGRSLWLFDSCDSIAGDASTTLGRWVDMAPAAQFLATSRTRLALSGEATLLIDALDVPADPDAAWDELKRCPSVELLLDRIKLARVDYDPAAAEEPILAAIAATLEGIPLALEFAAARTSVMQPAQLLTRLRAEPDLLGGGWTDVPDRQRTMGATVAWSWRQLDEIERAVLAQLAVFRGGFDLEAAEAIVALDHCSRPQPIATVIQSLRDHSLLRTQHLDNGSIRFSLYEIVREHAAGQLDDDLEQATCRRHAIYYASNAERPGIELVGDDAMHRLECLTRESDNLLAAHRWVVGRPPMTGELVTLALRIALTLDPLLSLTGPISLHVALLDQALAAAAPLLEPAALVGQAFEARGRARIFQGEPDQGRRDFEQALAIAEAAADSWLAGRCLLSLARAELTRWDGAEARAHLERALPVLASAGDRFGQARALSNLGLLHYRRGETRGARAALERAMAIHREIGDREGAAHTLAFLGPLHHQAPNQDLARGYYHEALAIYRSLGNRWREGLMLANLAVLEQEAGAFRSAASYYDEARQLAARAGARGLEAIVVALSGTLVHEQGHLPEAMAIYREALERARAASDRRYAGLVLGLLGAAEASADNLQASDRAHRAARQELAGLDEANVVAAVTLLRGHHDLARARAEPGSEPKAALLEAARSRLAVATGKLLLSEDVRFAVRLLRQGLASADPDARRVDDRPLQLEDALLVSANGRSVRTPTGLHIDLSRRAAPRRLVQRLATERLESPGQPLPLTVLFEAGWPDQSIHPSSAVNRVHVALTTLRNIGLRAVLVSDPDGYLFDPAVPLHIVANIEAGSRG